ncbi:MAG: TIGR00375 family protein [Candidatus Altiarchaeota archaeon]|nr:TIGR00375 family protein [Candidatus Altiarchaeota archaeon]
MIEIDVDFHIHSKHSGGTSNDMVIPRIAEGARGKGLDVVGTGDATHQGWLKHLEKHLEGDGIYAIESSPTKFIITAEVEDRDRVHHLLLFPSIDCAKQFRSEIMPSSVNIDYDGRPKVRLSGEELVDLANDCDSMIGPCHAFTPWTAVYKEFDSLGDCYGDNLRYVKFLELGLSADSDMADHIRELGDITFMTNSDAHSPWPHRLGREFNRLSVKDLSFAEIQKAIERKDDRRFTLNVGLNPREGKYHETACTRCYTKFKVEDANRLKRRCPECGGMIKKGVKERIDELADGMTKHPKHRPPYIHIVPLAEVIGMARGIASVYGNKVQMEWQKMVEEFGSEIEILVDIDVERIRAYDKRIGDIIRAFREDKILYDAGGGGRYGRPLYDKPLRENFYDGSQKSLGDF